MLQILGFLPQEGEHWGQEGEHWGQEGEHWGQRESITTGIT